MVGLLDVNVLVALAWPNHVHHDVALRWFTRHSRLGWATCSLTQTAFVRVSSNRAVLPDARSPREARDLLRRVTALPHHLFWQDDVPFATTPLVAGERLLGHNQVTDAHLLALALRHGGRFVTLDAGPRSLVPAPHDPAQVVCPVVVPDR